ncbi:MAG: hypothetical protein ACLUVC_10925 [Longibaculum sp.]
MIKKNYVKISVCLLMLFIAIQTVFGLTTRKSCELKMGQSQVETDWVGTSKVGKFTASTYSDTRAGVYMFCYVQSASGGFTLCEKKVYINAGKSDTYTAYENNKHIFYIQLTSSMGNSTHATGTVEAI